MTSIFGPLDKRQRAASVAATTDEAGFSFEDRADLLNDLLEEDTTTFPLLSCPPEVLAAFLLFLEAIATVRLRPLCSSSRGSIDGNTGLWCSLTARDFEDLGGVTKHYRGLRTLADAWDNSRAFVRLEWDPLMICAPPSLRYALLATAKTRKRRWDECGHALGAGWSWFSAKVCRRMTTSTFLRWASLQHDVGSVNKMLEPFVGKPSQPEGEPAPEETHEGATPKDEGADGNSSAEPTQRFRCGRSDAVTLTFAAATDIYETVQRWHDDKHREMMRAHFKGPGDSQGSEDAMSPQSANAAFSATPTLDAAEAAMSAADSLLPASPPVAEAAPAPRGAASRYIEEAQLRLALELSKAEAAGSEKKAEAEVVVESPKVGLKLPPEKRKKEEPAGLLLRAEGSAPAMMVYLKEHCLAGRVDALPERFEASIESIVNKMTRSSMWVLLYESLTEELTFRAKLAAEALCASNVCAIDELLSTDISMSQELLCLPLSSRSCSASLMSSLSRLRAASCDEKLRQARCNLIRQASLEYCDHEDLTSFLDEQLQPLELEIDHFRGIHDAPGHAHTPHVADVGRLMFRNFCLLDCRVFRPLCLAAYALVHELHTVNDAETQGNLLELLEGLHSMLAACDVADDHLSASKDTKETFEEVLLKPITLAIQRYSDGGHDASTDTTTGRLRRKKMYK